MYIATAPANLLGCGLFGKFTREMADGFNWTDNPAFGYTLQVATELRYCEVVMQDHAYGVFLEKSFAEIHFDDQLQWRLTAGIPLPNSVIAEIGQKIESVFM